MPGGKTRRLLCAAGVAGALTAAAIALLVGPRAEGSSNPGAVIRPGATGAVAATDSPDSAPSGALAPVEVAPAPSHTHAPSSAGAAASLPSVEVTDAVELPKAIEPSAECSRALAAVEGAGLELPDATAFRCPGSTETFVGDRQHSGVACWGQLDFCPGSSYIAVNPSETAAGAHHLQYVIAHEICHIQSYLAAGWGGEETAADACAAAAGFPRP